MRTPQQLEKHSDFLDRANDLGQPLAVVDCWIYNELQLHYIVFELSNAVNDHISVYHVAFLQEGHKADELVVIEILSVIEQCFNCCLDLFGLL